jgi:COP9 signalosome complex subunit 4
VIQDDDAINAEVFIKKASFMVNNCRDEALNLQYKVCFFNYGGLSLDNCSAA